jgi:hypothetical protein
MPIAAKEVAARVILAARDMAKTQRQWYVDVAVK